MQGTTIKNVKTKIKKQKGVPVDQFNPIFYGKKLDDESTFSHYGIQEGSNLHMVLRLRASPCILPNMEIKIVVKSESAKVFIYKIKAINTIENLK